MQSLLTIDAKIVLNPTNPGIRPRKKILVFEAHQRPLRKESKLLKLPKQGIIQTA